MGRGEGGGGASGRHSVAQIDRMEQRVKDALFNVPLHMSVTSVVTTPSNTIPTSTAPPPTFHGSSYHAELPDQIRNRSRPPQNLDTRRYNSATTGTYGSTPSTTRPVYPSSTAYPQASPPPFAPSPSSTPHIPSVTCPQHQVQHSISQEWTEYTSALPPEGSQTNTTASSTSNNTAFSPTAPNQRTSQSRGLDISEFDPIHS